MDNSPNNALSAKTSAITAVAHLTPPVMNQLNAHPVPEKKPSCIRQKSSDLPPDKQAEKQVKWQFTTTNSGEEVRQSNSQQSSITSNDNHSRSNLLSPSTITSTHSSPTATAGDRKLSVYDTFRQKKQSVTSYVDTHPGWQRFLGIICVVSAGFVCVFSSVASNYLLESFSSVEVSFLRFACVPFLTLPILIYQHINPFSWELMASECGILIFVRGIVGSGNFLLRMVTFERLPLGDATTILFTTPVFVGIMAKIFLGERYHTEYFLSTLLALFGCMLVPRPPALMNAVGGIAQPPVYVEADSTRRRIEGTAAALLAAALSGLVYIIMRRIRRVEPNVILFHLGIIGSLCTGAWVLLTEEKKQLPLPTKLMDWVWLLVMTFASNVGLWLINLGLRFENANMVALLGAGDIVWAFLAQWIVFGVIPQTPAVAGATLIIGSVILVALRKHMQCGRNGKRVIAVDHEERISHGCKPSAQQLPCFHVTPPDSGEAQNLLPSPATERVLRNIVINVYDEHYEEADCTNGVSPSATRSDRKFPSYQNAHIVKKDNIRAKSVCVFDDASKMVMPCDSSTNVARQAWSRQTSEADKSEAEDIAAEAIGLSAVDGVTLNKFYKAKKQSSNARSLRTSTAW